MGRSKVKKGGSSGSRPWAYPLAVGCGALGVAALGGLLWYSQHHHRHRSSTSTSTSTNSSPPAGDPVQDGPALLATLLGPNITLEAFLRDYWQQQPLLIKRRQGEPAGAAARFYDAFPVVHPGEVEAVLAVSHPSLGKSGRLLPDWRLVRHAVGPDGAVASEEAPPLPEGPCAGRSKVLKDRQCRVAHARWALGAGYSLLINMVHAKWPRAQRLVEAFQSALGLQTSMNLYWSPMGSQAFDIHYDVREVFALQIAGTKRWKLYDTAVEHPRGDMEKRDLSGMRAQGTPSDEFILEAGDLLYIPSGLVHIADTAHAAPDARLPRSLHLTVGVECLSELGSWEALLLDLIARATAGRPETADMRCAADDAALAEALAAPVEVPGLSPLRWGELLAVLLVQAAATDAGAALRTAVPMASAAVRAAGGTQRVIGEVGAAAALFAETADVAAAARYVQGSGGRLRRLPVPDGDGLGAALWARVEGVLEAAAAREALMGAPLQGELQRVVGRLVCALRDPGQAARALGVYDRVRQGVMDERRGLTGRLLQRAAREWDAWQGGMREGAGAGAAEL